MAALRCAPFTDQWLWYNLIRLNRLHLDESLRMQRQPLGWAVAIGLIVWLALTLGPWDFAGIEMVQAFCLRLGLVGGATWLAVPQLERVPPWLAWTLAAVAVALIVRPRLAIWLIPLLLLLVWLRPKARA